MSDRIQKELGWGLILPEGSEDDLNPNSSSTYQQNYLTVGDFLTAVKTTGFELNPLPEETVDAGRIDVEELITFKELPNDDVVLLVKDINLNPDWTRHDDLIDWVEADYNADFDASYKLLPHGIFPYWGIYMNAETGEHVGSDFLDSYNLLKSLNAETERLDDFVQSFGYKDFATAEALIVPYIPDAIKTTVKVLELFKDEKTVLRLRPMLVTSWS